MAEVIITNPVVPALAEQCTRIYVNIRIAMYEGAQVALDKVVAEGHEAAKQAADGDVHAIVTNMLPLWYNLLDGGQKEADVAAALPVFGQSLASMKDLMDGLKAGCNTYLAADRSTEPLLVSALTALQAAAPAFTRAF